MRTNHWQLYSTMKGFAKASAEMDKAWEEAKRLLPDKPAVERATAAEKYMDKVMERLSRFGASDTEPRWEVIDRVERHFGVRGTWFGY